MKLLLELFRKPSTEELIAREIDDARRALLQAMTGRDYAAAIVAYHEQRLDRLRSMSESQSMTEGGTS